MGHYFGGWETLARTEKDGFDKQKKTDLAEQEKTDLVATGFRGAQLWGI